MPLGADALAVLLVCAGAVCLLTALYAFYGGARLRARLLSGKAELERQALRLERENKKLQESLKLHSTILNMSPYPVWQRNKELDVEYYNLAFGEIAEEAEGASAPELDRKLRVLARQAMEGGKPVTERRHIIDGGQRKLYQVSEFPVSGEGILVGFAHDITEVERLREDMQRYISAQADLLESSASAMAIYGPDMRLKSFNYAFVALWRLDEAWLESEPTYSEILEALREKRKLPEQANFVQFKQQQLRLFTELIQPHEEFFYLPDGKVLRVIAIPHALGGILFAYEDVTDRLALERSYNTLIAVQRETLDNLYEGVAVFGEDGRLRLSNPVYLKLWNINADLAGAEPHIGVLLEKCRAFYLCEDWEAYKKNLIAQLQQRAHGVFRLERADGKVLEWARVPLPDGAMLTSYLDVTDSTLLERSLRERNEALQEADRLKTEFLANVSYELRSPLTSITGFSEMLRQEYFGALGEKQREYVDGIHQSSQHLMHLVNDILDLASIEAGYMRLEVTYFDIQKVMKSILTLVQERAREHGITVQFVCPAKIGKMLADETRIKQILFNLLSNAIKYSLPGGQIRFGTAERGESDVALWVEDEGQGIALEEHETVFGTFYKGKRQDVPKAKGKRPGAGLGLAIVKSFVELHGGRVELAAEPGKGTRISCLFKRDNPDLQPFMKKKGQADAAGSPPAEKMWQYLSN